MFTRLLSRWLGFSILLGGMMFGQSSGKLSGKVTNMQGQGVPNAELRLKNGADVIKSATTSSDGAFTFESLADDTYTVEIEAAGKTQKSSKSLTVNPNSMSALEILFDDSQLSTSGKPMELEIKATSSTIQADSAEISRTYTTRTVRSLPLIDRQNQDLISLMPGVTPPVIQSDRIADPQRSRIYNVNGLPSYANAYYQDGAYQNEQFSGSQSRVAPNVSVQQLDVRTSNFNAEYGLAGGAYVNSVTRPGTNPLHGSLFGLHTNRFLTTRNPLNFTTNNPGFNVNQFGGSAGGPIVKNKTFWFLGYEAFLRRGSILQFDTVPTAAMRSGNFSQMPGTMIFNPSSGSANGSNRTLFPNGVIPQSSMNPASIRILSSLPLPNQPGDANNLVGAAMLREDQHRMDGKIDHRFSEKSTGFFRYGFTHGGVDQGSQLGALGNAAQAALRNHNAVASLTQSFSNSLAAEFRVGYSRYRNAITPSPVNGSLNSDLSAIGFDRGLPQINITGFGTYGLPSNYPSKPVNNTYEAATNWNWHTGLHHLKVGAQVVQIRADGFNQPELSQRGTFNFGPGATSLSQGNGSSQNFSNNSFAAFLLGRPTNAGVSFFEQTPTYRQTLTSGYVTDTINLWKNLHIELGVRYDVFSPLRTRLDTGAAGFDVSTNTRSLGNGAGDYDLNNIAPRIGIVLRPIERIAIRAGYGLQYFATPFLYSGVNQAAVATQSGLIGGFGSTPFALPTLTSTTTLNQSFLQTSKDSQTPYVQSFNFMVQSDLGNGFLMDIGYVGNLGRQLPYNRALNFARPGSGASSLPFSQFGRTAGIDARGTGLNSNYNALQVNLTKRFGAGLSMAGAYTYGKVLDTGFNQINPFDTRNNYGPADFDRTHILAVSHLWQLPFGAGSKYLSDGPMSQILGSWQLNGILRWATGSAYSIFADPLNCNCPGVSTLRAGGSTGPSINGQSGFDPSRFANSSNGTFGITGRNVYRGPDFFTYDTSLFRSFPVRESFNVELRAEAYNVTNNTNLANPLALLSSRGAGQSTSTVNGAFGRQFQVGIRLLY